LTQTAPFIVLKIDNNLKATEKERCVLFSYRDFIVEQFATKKEDKEEKAKLTEEEKSQAITFGPLYTAKRFLYLGWPFEEVCYALTENVNNFLELLRYCNILLRASKELVSEGYRNPADSNYYITFKVDSKKFPINLEKIIKDGYIDSSKQLDELKIIDYDESNNHIILQTPIFIHPEICKGILRAESQPLITTYNPAVDKIDVKSEEKVFKKYKSERKQLGKIYALTKHEVYEKNPDKKKNDEKLEFRSDTRSSSISKSTTDHCEVRKISDYYYAYDRIKKICEERNFPFEDVTVVVGPLERVFGPGTQGGFMGKKQFESGNIKIPFEIESGLFVSPPIIAVNSTTMTGYDEQTETLIHEYSHNIYSITNPEHEHEYNKKEHSQIKQKQDPLWWNMYLNDPDERQAHKEEIKFEIISGKSIDEIIRNKIGGEVTKNNYLTALKFKELVQEAFDELKKEEEENEEPNGTNE
jgi:hypothetical protein